MTSWLDKLIEADRIKKESDKHRKALVEKAVIYVDANVIHVEFRTRLSNEAYGLPSDVDYAGLWR